MRTESCVTCFVVGCTQGSEVRLCQNLGRRWRPIRQRFVDCLVCDKIRLKCFSIVDGGAKEEGDGESVGGAKEGAK